MNKVHDGALLRMGDFKPSHQENVKFTPSTWLFPKYAAEFDVVANLMAIGEPDKTRASGEVSYYLLDQNNKHVLYEGDSRLYVHIEASVPRAGDNRFSCTIRKDNGLGTEVIDSPYGCDVNLRSADRFDPKPEFTIRKKEFKTPPSKDFAAHLFQKYCADINSKSCKFTQTAPITQRTTDWTLVPKGGPFSNMGDAKLPVDINETFQLKGRFIWEIEASLKLSPFPKMLDFTAKASHKSDVTEMTATKVTTSFDVPPHEILGVYGRGSVRTLHGSFVIDDGKDIYTLPNIDADLPANQKADIAIIPLGECYPGNCVTQPIPSFDNARPLPEGSVVEKAGSGK